MAPERKKKIVVKAVGLKKAMKALKSGMKVVKPVIKR